MKIKSTITAFALLVTPMTWADEEKHDHDKHAEHEHGHDIKAPNGGRVLHDVEPHAEFFITKDRKVQITFLTFEKTKNGFLSNEKLPEGKLVPIVLMFKNAKGQKSNVKFNVNMADCPTCDFLEYACTCDHDDDHEGHDHAEHNDHKDHDHAKEKK